MVEEVGVQPHFDVWMLRHLLDPGRIAIGREALVFVIEVAVVVVIANGQPRNDASGQILGVRLPLLASVVLDERFVEWASNQLDAFVIQVLRICSRQLASLLLD
jgi:hypothetical protein